MGLVSVYITAVSFEDTRMVRLISYAWTMVPQIFYTGWIDPALNNLPDGGEALRARQIRLLARVRHYTSLVLVCVFRAHQSSVFVRVPG
jgi:hypothetical protein